MDVRYDRDVCSVNEDWVVVRQASEGVKNGDSVVVVCVDQNLGCWTYTQEICDVVDC